MSSLLSLSLEPHIPPSLSPCPAQAGHRSIPRGPLQPCAVLLRPRGVTAHPTDQAESTPAPQTIAQTIFQKRFRKFLELHSSRGIFPPRILRLQLSRSPRPHPSS